MFEDLVFTLYLITFLMSLPVNIFSNRDLSISDDLRRCLATDSQTSCAVLVILWWAWHTLTICTTYENPKRGWIRGKIEIVNDSLSCPLHILSYPVQCMVLFHFYSTDVPMLVAQLKSGSGT